MIHQEYTDKEIMEFIRVIGKPTLEFMVKRIQNKIIQDKNNSKMPVNAFLLVIIGALTTINVSTLRWLSESSHPKIGESIDIDTLRLALIENLNGQLGITVN